MTATVAGILLTGIHSARPGAGAVPVGTLYSCTTHSLVYQSDGSAWSTWATLGGGGGGGGGTTPSGVLVTGPAHAAPTNPYVLAWDTAVYDPDGYWASGDPTKLTVPSGKGGRLFLAAVTMENNNNTALIGFWVNGSPRWAGPAAGPYILNAAGVLHLADGDYVQAVLTSGANIITSDQVPTCSLAPIG
jgi:hypothetical protein